MAILEDGLLLHHGSYAPVESIDLTKCAPGKDFGKGFYLTSDEQQARRFLPSSARKAAALKRIPASQRFGYVSTFKLHSSNASVPTYAFDGADSQWLWFVARNRRSALAEALNGKIDPLLAKSEIIVGKVANDTTNPVITTYLNGLYGSVDSKQAVDTAVGMLMPDKLKDQYCFLTQRAIDCLEFVEARRYEF